MLHGTIVRRGRNGRRSGRLRDGPETGDRGPVDRARAAVRTTSVAPGFDVDVDHMPGIIPFMPRINFAMPPFCIVFITPCI
jgi:hypothetical protein